MPRLINNGLGVLLVALLCGCESLSHSVDIAQPTQARPQAAALVPINNGAIFQSAAYRPMYETYRARMVGDIITVVISENITAKQESTSTIEKKGAVAGSVTAVPFMRAEQLAKLGAGGSSSNTFDGKGSTASTHNFSGTITATVIEVLPNGHLLIAGEKQIGVNASVEALRFSGQVDPTSIQPGNTVASTQVANVRVEQRGHGAQADAQGIGWLAGFFLNLLPF